MGVLRPNNQYQVHVSRVDLELDALKYEVRKIGIIEKKNRRHVWRNTRRRRR